MTAKLTKAYVSTQNRMQELSDRRDAGQGALEYIGILAVVVVVIGLAIAGFQAASGDIDTGISDLIKKVTGQG